MEILSLEAGLEKLKQNIAPIRETEIVNLEKSLGRMLAEKIIAPQDQPPFDRSPLDGYAFRAESTVSATEENPVRLRIIGEECAGDFFAGAVGANEAVRIMTGAAIPQNATAVIRQEDVTNEGEYVIINRKFRAGENICLAGEDVKKGAEILAAGTKIDAVAIGVLASLGFAQVNVYRQPKIALFSTGDELIAPGDELSPGKIYNSNLFLLTARLKELGYVPKITGTLPDDGAAAAAKIKQIVDAENIDLVITTGGVSVGKKDIMHEVWPLLGAEKIFWRLALKPGSPVLSYKYKNTLGLALSGNPFAALATFELLAREVIAELAQDLQIKLLPGEAALKNSFGKKSPGRRFIRAKIEGDFVTVPDTHMSGSLASMLGCNALIDIEAGTGELKVGERVKIWHL